jgi:uncharacterized membrane protein YeaQ/YmgE (transglycosylase-associated protein family)
VPRYQPFCKRNTAWRGSFGSAKNRFQDWLCRIEVPNACTRAFDRAEKQQAKETVMICSLVGWAFFGLLVGALARLIWPGRQSMGLTGTILLGVAGSIVGGLLGHLLGGGPMHYYPAGFAMSTLGAILVLWFVAETSDRPSTR